MYSYLGSQVEVVGLSSGEGSSPSPRPEMGRMLQVNGHYRFEFCRRRKAM